MISPTISWDEWLMFLKIEWWLRFEFLYDEVGYDKDAFREMYEDGLTPSEAIQEEYDALCALGDY